MENSQNSPNKRSPNNFQKKQQDYLEQEKDEIFAKYPFYHQGVPELPDELYPLPKKRTNYKIDELQNQNQNNQISNGRQRKRSSNIITEESPFLLNKGYFMQNQENDEERYYYPQLTKQQMKQQDRNLSIINEQKKQMNYRMKEERENKKKAYEHYLEQLNDTTFDQVVQMTKDRQRKIQIVMDENSVSVDLVPQSEIKKMEEGTEEFYVRERSLNDKKKQLKQKLVDKFNVKLNFETEEFQDKNVYDYYSNQQLSELRSQRKQSFPIRKEEQKNNNYSVNGLNANHNIPSLYLQQNEALPSSLQQQISNRVNRQFNSLQTSPRTEKENQFYNQYSLQNNKLPVQNTINKNGQLSQLSQRKQSLQPIQKKQSEQQLSSNNYNNISLNLQSQNQQTSNQSLSQIQQNGQNNSIEVAPIIDISKIIGRRQNHLNLGQESYDINKFDKQITQQSRQKGDQSVQFTEQSPSSIQLRTSPGKRFREDSPFLTTTGQYPHQKLLLTSQNKQNNAKNYQDFSLNQCQIPTEASQQYSPNSQDRGDNISPFLFQSSSRNSTQFPSIVQKPHNNRIGSSFSRYKVTSPHQTRHVYSFSKETDASSVLKQGEEALETLRKENQQLLNSKYTKEHAKIINNIRKKSMYIEHAMKETDNSFSQIVGNIKNEQVKILTNLSNAKAPQSVQIRLINDFQNILGVYGAQLS